jgi:hypothetical protein
MTVVLQVLQYATATGLVLLAAITVRDCLRSRERSRGYLALAIGLLGFVALISQLATFLRPPISVAMIEVVVVGFMLSGYALMLFRDSLAPLSFRAQAGVGARCVVSTLAISVIILFPQAPTWLQLAVVTPWIGVWIGAVGEPVVRFWLVSRDRPVVQRARLRALSGGYGGTILVLFVIIVAAPLDRTPIYQLGVQLLSLSVIPFLFVAFAPPRWLRRVWSAREEEAFSGAVRDLLLFSAGTSRSGSKSAPRSSRPATRSWKPSRTPSRTICAPPCAPSAGSPNSSSIITATRSTHGGTALRGPGQLQRGRHGQADRRPTQLLAPDPSAK